MIIVLYILYFLTLYVLGFWTRKEIENKRIEKRDIAAAIAGFFLLVLPYAFLFINTYPSAVNFIVPLVPVFSAGFAAPERIQSFLPKPKDHDS